MATRTEEKTHEYPTAFLNDYAKKFMSDLEEEKERLMNLNMNFPIISQVIEEAMVKLLTTGRIPGKDYADIYQQKPVKLVQNVYVPTKQFPTFNFAGKILGPKGASLRSLQQETQCKIAIKGSNSMRDKAKEEELRESGDPRHAHLKRPMFVQISTFCTAAEAYARVANALHQLRKYIIPDNNDEISQEQMRTLVESDPKLASKLHHKYKVETYKPTFEAKPKPLTAGSKFVDLIKRISNGEPYAEQEEYEAEQEYEEEEELPIEYKVVPTRYVKRPVGPAAPKGYYKAAPVPTFKRTTPQNFAHSQAKRMRPTPAHPYGYS